MSRPKGHLLRVLGVAFGLAAVVGSVVGQGILRTPGMVAGAVHSPEAMIGFWLLGGLIALIGGAVYVELGASVPSAGGPYDYARRAFGPAAAALTGWALLLAMIFAVANTAVVVGEYMVRLGVVPGPSPTLPSIAAMVLFCALNWSGTRLSAGVQIAFSAAKGAVLAGLVLVLFAQPGLPAEAAQVEPAGALTLAGAAMALRLIVGTYNGWQDIALYGEEMTDPGKALPRAMFGGLLSIIALYLLINLALLHMLSPQDMALSNLPAADAARLALGDRADTVLTAFGVLSVAAITSLTTMSTTRLAYSLARGEMLPGMLANVSSSGTPRVALLLVTGATILCIAGGDYDSTSSSGTTLYQVCVVMALVCAWALRRREPDLARPWQMPFYPWPIVLALITNLALLAAFIYDDPFNSLLGLAIVAAIAGIEMALRRRRPKPME
jgi:APA family basic amino acid/polyamine antiporter